MFQIIKQAFILDNGDLSNYEMQFTNDDFIY